MHGSLAPGCWRRVSDLKEMSEFSSESLDFIFYREKKRTGIN
jgi:hypothetical protein